MPGSDLGQTSTNLTKEEYHLLGYDGAISQKILFTTTAVKTSNTTT
jgi:hypothetical protein